MQSDRQSVEYADPVTLLERRTTTKGYYISGHYINYIGSSTCFISYRLIVEGPDIVSNQSRSMYIDGSWSYV